MQIYRVLPMLALGACLVACTSMGSGGPKMVRSNLAQGEIQEAGGVPAGWNLVWADEFDHDGLPDPQKWGYDTERNSKGWYNNEKQYYSRARPENSRVESGMLIIEARHDDTSGYADSGGQDYSSARLVTRGKASWTYGAWEVRAKLPCGRGTWPAIWMLADKPNMQWPDDGEIDIMEHVGYDKGVIHGTIHTRAYNHMRSTQKGAELRVEDVCGSFHRYQMVWTPEAITIGVDDRNYFRFINDGDDSKSTWPFSKPQYLLLNIAIGGDWGGARGIDDSIFPVRMEVDYVRVWQAPKEAGKAP